MLSEAITSPSKDLDDEVIAHPAVAVVTLGGEAHLKALLEESYEFFSIH